MSEELVSAKRFIQRDLVVTSMRGVVLEIWNSKDALCPKKHDNKKHERTKIRSKGRT